MCALLLIFVRKLRSSSASKRASGVSAILIRPFSNRAETLLTRYSLPTCHSFLDVRSPGRRRDPKCREFDGADA
jgi:hypothetical protein